MIDNATKPSPLPIILSRPHGGLGIPEEVQDRLAIDKIAIYNECDLWIDKLFDFGHPDLASIVPPGFAPNVLETISMPIARGLIDVNRPIRSLGKPDGPVKTRTSYGEQIYTEPLTDELNQQLIERYWCKFHNGIRDALSKHKDDVKLFIDCHNMAQYGPTKYLDAGQPRPLVCITNLGDADGVARPEYGWTFTPPKFAQKAVQIAWELFEDLELLEPEPGAPPPPVALLNQPFWGSYIIAEHFGPGTNSQNDNKMSYTSPSSPTCVMIEVNRGLFVGNQTKATKIAPPNEERISEIRKRLFLWSLRLLELIDSNSTLD